MNKNGVILHDAIERTNARLAELGFSFFITSADLDGRWKRHCDGDQREWSRSFLLAGGVVLTNCGDWRDKDRTTTIAYKDSGELTEIDQRRVMTASKARAKLRTDKNVLAKEFVQQRWTEYQARALDQRSAYLEGKGLPEAPNTVVIKKDDQQRILCIPMYDESGELWNIQQIFDSGFKKYAPNASAKELLHEIPGTTDVIYIGEGFATCVAVWEATKAHVYCAFTVGQMEAVLKIALRRHDAQKIVLLADFDGTSFHKMGLNAGMHECQVLTQKYQVRAAVPVEDWFEVVKRDFADLELEARQAALQKLCTGDELAGFVFKEKREKKPAPAAAAPEPKLTLVPAGAVLRPAPEPAEAEADEYIPFTDPPVEKPRVPTPEMFPSMAHGFFFEIEQGVYEKGPQKGEEKPPKYAPDYDGFAQFMRWKYMMKSSDAFTYTYADGFYQLRSSLELQSIACAQIRAQTPINQIKSFVDKARAMNFARIEGLKIPEGLINVANGVLDVRTREVRTHSPSNFFRYKLPHRFDPNAKYPEWTKFLGKVFEGDQELVDLAGEIFGYVLLGGAPFLHKAFLLLGEGRNGKGVFLEVLQALIGRGNYSAIPLSRLDNPFSVVEADGKLANIVTEVTMKNIESEAFKTAVAGETMVAAKKFQDEFGMQFQARMIASANRAPYMNDPTTGVHEKFCVLPFNWYVPPSERIGDFARRFLIPELSGILNWSLDGLERLLDRGNLPSVKAVERQAVLLRSEIDPVFAWFSERFSVGEDEPENLVVHAKTEMKVSAMFENYDSWCHRERHQPVKPLTFSKRVCVEIRKMGEKFKNQPHPTWQPHLNLTEKKRAAWVEGNFVLKQS